MAMGPLTRWGPGQTAPVAPLLSVVLEGTLTKSDHTTPSLQTKDFQVKQVGMCKKRYDTELKFYCETCEELVCLY